MASFESLQAMLERRMIRQMALNLDNAESWQQSERYMSALRDLVTHADPSLDARQFDDWTEGRLRRCGLWVWDSACEAGACPPRVRH